MFNEKKKKESDGRCGSDDYSDERQCKCANQHRDTLNSSHFRYIQLEEIYAEREHPWFYFFGFNRIQ